MRVISSHDPDFRTHFTPTLMAPGFLNSDPADSVPRNLPMIASSDRCRSCEVNLSSLRQPKEKPLLEDIRCDGCRGSVREIINGTVCCKCERCFCVHCASGLVDHFHDGTRTHSVWWDNRAKLFPTSLLDEISNLSIDFRACRGCMRSVCYDCVANAPWCACSYCAENYICVSCLNHSSLRRMCRKHQESKARKHFKERMEKEILYSISELAHMVTHPTPSS